MIKTRKVSLILGDRKYVIDHDLATYIVDLYQITRSISTRIAEKNIPLGSMDDILEPEIEFIENRVIKPRRKKLF